MVIQNVRKVENGRFRSCDDLLLGGYFFNAEDAESVRQFLRRNYIFVNPFATFARNFAAFALNLRWV